LLLRRLSVRSLLRRLPVLRLLLRGLTIGRLLPILLLLLLRLSVARLRLPVSGRGLTVLGRTGLLRRAGHQLRALERLLRDLTLLGLTLLGKRSGLTGILRSTRRVAGGLIHRLSPLSAPEGNRNEPQEKVISP